MLSQPCNNKPLNTTHVMTFVFLLVIISQSAVDMYLPSFPAMTEFFHTTPEKIQLTLSFFIFGYACSQLIYGPLSDFYGRRPILISGLTLFAFATLACAFATSVNMLLAFRLVQGFGAGVANVHQRALLRDIFTGKDLNKSASYVAAIWALVPIVAPLAGGFLQLYSRWQTNFFLLAGILILLIPLIAIKLPETRAHAALSKLTIKKIFLDYKILLTTRAFICNAFCCAILNGIFLTFNIAAPFILQIKCNLTPMQYAQFLMLPCSGFLAGSYFNSRLTQRYKIHNIILTGYLLMLCAAVTLLFFTYTHTASVINFMSLMCVILLGLGLVYSNCVAGAMQCPINLIGSAGAMFGFLVSLIGSTVSILFAALFPTSMAALAMVIIILLGVGFLFYSRR